MALSSVLIGSVSFSAIGTANADTAIDPGKSTGTLKINDGAQTLTSVDSLDFGETNYDPTKDFSTKLTATDKKVSVSDTTVAQTAWTLNGQTTNADIATLTINGTALTDTDTAVFTKAADAKFGTQDVAIDPATTSISLTSAQMSKNGAKKVIINVAWTLTNTTSKPAQFN